MSIINKEKLAERVKFLFSDEMIENFKKAEDVASCKICGRVVFCGEVSCENTPCDLKERRLK